jgi:hypothetical protein
MRTDNTLAVLRGHQSRSTSARAGNTVTLSPSVGRVRNRRAAQAADAPNARHWVKKVKSLRACQLPGLQFTNAVQRQASGPGAVSDGSLDSLTGLTLKPC